MKELKDGSNSWRKEVLVLISAAFVAIVAGDSNWIISNITINKRCWRIREMLPSTRLWTTLTACKSSSCSGASPTSAACIARITIYFYHIIGVARNSVGGRFVRIIHLRWLATTRCAGSPWKFSIGAAGPYTSSSITFRAHNINMLICCAMCYLKFCLKYFLFIKWLNI